MGMKSRIQEYVMKKKWLFAGIGVILIFTLGATAGFSQVLTAQNRIPQQIIINGQPANGAYVTAPGGGIQSFTCSMPQQYSTPDGAAQGWACYEPATGVWLLNALPPAQAQAPAPAPQQPTVIYQQPPATVIYQQPAPTVVYTTPVYGPPVRPVVVEPAYPSSVVLGTAVINAAGRIAAAAIAGSHYPHEVEYRGYGHGEYRGYGHGHDHGSFHGRHL
jgi:hypothetical protein